MKPLIRARAVLGVEVKDDQNTVSTLVWLTPEQWREAVNKQRQPRHSAQQWIVEGVEMMQRRGWSALPRGVGRGVVCQESFKAEVTVREPEK